MSQTLSGVDGSFTYKKYYNTEITKKDWCDYKGFCPVFSDTHIGKEPCHSCTYKKKLDIPKLLKERNERR